MRNPTVLTGVIIFWMKTAKYGSPKRARSKGDLVDRGLWDQAVDRAPAFGPIHFSNHCWMGSVTSSFDIGFQNEVGLRIENSVGLIYHNLNYVFAHPFAFRQDIIPNHLILMPMPPPR